MKYSEKTEFITERLGVSLLNFEGGLGVPLLNFVGDPGVPLLNFELGPGVLVPRLHHPRNNERAKQGCAKYMGRRTFVSRRQYFYGAIYTKDSK